METLTDRERKILEMIMGSYITSAEPVGSRTLSKLISNKWSSATIRNVMSDLEEQGFLYNLTWLQGGSPQERPSGTT